ncbi:conjugative transposon protein TraM [Nibrella saemangeumensis]|uniref:Conjugative transposon protein TraM n=1 Tax=Nibrella saemangeumensis TaxID=1084526 RepID=A0ABP8N0J2_9BACT
MNTALSATHTEVAFFRERKAMLMYPVIIVPFLTALFWILGGGKGERYLAEEAAADRPGAGGFNASVPQAKNSVIRTRSVETPGYGSAQGGQVLSSFTHTRQDSIAQGLKAIPASSPATVERHASSLAAPQPATPSPVAQPTPVITPAARPAQRAPQVNQAAMAATSGGNRSGKSYYYRPPQQSAATSENYSATQAPQYVVEEIHPTLPSPADGGQQSEQSATNTVRLSDKLATSRLSDEADNESPFYTAPTGGNRPQPTRAVLNPGEHSRRHIAWMIPVVVHEDQAIREGQQVKLRLLKEVTVEGVTVPANSILYAVGRLAEDRLILTVRSLQLGGQLIPLDLDVYDTDGSPGVNVPGLSRQVGGQIQSSAIQGVNLPGVGALANSVLNSARMNASNAVRQPMIRLRGGYNLYLKAQ